jgi:ATP-binding cassette subfamily B protein
MFGSFAFLAYRAVNGSISLGDLVMFYQAFQRGLTSLQDFLAGLASIYENNLFLNNFYEFLDLREVVMDPARPVPVPRPVQGAIRFENVSFEYQAGGRKILDSVSFEIKAGQTVAIVGENGAGKTTLIKLLCRLYDPTEGRILLDGVDLREMSKTEYRQALSVVFQDYVHYFLTASENIWFGNARGPMSQHRIERAAREAGADEVIRKLPQGYDTVLGKLFHDGEELSIGQWQKVALARAFLRDASIIIMDEPTSALDAIAEHEVFKRFRKLSQDRTAILISHRLATVKTVDCIFVMDGGRLVESGNHETLMRNRGVYAHLFETQAHSYR